MSRTNEPKWRGRRDHRVLSIYDSVGLMITYLQEKTDCQTTFKKALDHVFCYRYSVMETRSVGWEDKVRNMEVPWEYSSNGTVCGAALVMKEVEQCCICSWRNDASAQKTPFHLPWHYLLLGGRFSYLLCFNYGCSSTFSPQLRASPKAPSSPMMCLHFCS